MVIAWGQGISLSDEASVIKNFNLFKDAVSQREDTPQSDLLPVNIAFDRELVEVCDQWGIPKGNTDITDRAKLAALLQGIREGGNRHRMIFLDVFLNPEFKTPADSLLFSLIAEMPRIVIPRHADEPEIPEIIRNKSGISDYSVSYNEDNFLKYQYLTAQGDTSMAMKAYLDHSGHQLTGPASFPLDNGRLFTRSEILDYPLRIDAEYSASGDKILYNLGADLLDAYTPEDLNELIEGKDILVGDFSERDNHSTFIGNVSGPVIVYTAYLTLLYGRHLIPFWVLAAIYLILTVMSYLAFTGKSLADTLPQWRIMRSHAVSFIISWCGFATILLVLALVVYLFSGKLVDVLVLATYFSILEAIIPIFQSLPKTSSKKQKTS